MTQTFATDHVHQIANGRPREEDLGAGGSGQLPIQMAKEFLLGKRSLNNVVLMGLHQTLVAPGLVGKVVAAHKSGAKLGSAIGTAGDVRALIHDPRFDWGGGQGPKPGDRPHDTEVVGILQAEAEMQLEPAPTPTSSEEMNGSEELGMAAGETSPPPAFAHEAKVEMGTVAAQKPNPVHPGQTKKLDLYATLRTDRNRFVLENLKKYDRVQILKRDAAGGWLLVRHGKTEGWILGEHLGLGPKDVESLPISKQRFDFRLAKGGHNGHLTYAGGSPYLSELDYQVARKEIPAFLGIDDKMPGATIPAKTEVGRRIQEGEGGPKILVFLSQPATGHVKELGTVVWVYVSWSEWLDSSNWQSKHPLSPKAHLKTTPA